MAVQIIELNSCHKWISFLALFCHYFATFDTYKLQLNRIHQHKSRHSAAWNAPQKTHKLTKNRSLSSPFLMQILKLCCLPIAITQFYKTLASECTNWLIWKQLYGNRKINDDSDDAANKFSFLFCIVPSNLLQCSLSRNLSR